jgi:hypothetical protein
MALSDHRAGVSVAAAGARFDIVIDTDGRQPTRAPPRSVGNSRSAATPAQSPRVINEEDDFQPPKRKSP